MAAFPLNPTNAPGLKTLVDELKDFHILPITPNNQKMAQRALRRPQANAESVSRIIKQDPALTLRIIFSANQTLLKQDNAGNNIALEKNRAPCAKEC